MDFLNFLLNKIILKNYFLNFSLIDHLRENNKEIKKKEIMFEFYKRVINHIFIIYELNLMRADLQKIMFSDAFITANGQVGI